MNDDPEFASGDTDTASAIKQHIADHNAAYSKNFSDAIGDAKPDDPDYNSRFRAAMKKASDATHKEMIARAKAIEGEKGKRGAAQVLYGGYE